MAQGEDELKYELTERAYLSLLAKAAQQSDVTQVFSNTYFTVSEAMARRDWVLRLRRFEEGPAELTLKIGREVEPGMFRSVEFATRVDSASLSSWEKTEPLVTLRREISLAPLVELGTSRNERNILAAPIGLVPRWEIDRTTLPGGVVVFELEIEWPAGSSPSAEEVASFRSELERWMEQQGLAPFQPSRKTKYRRFLDALGETP